MTVEGVELVRNSRAAAQAYRTPGRTTWFRIEKERVGWPFHSWWPWRLVEVVPTPRSAEHPVKRDILGTFATWQEAMQYLAAEWDVLT